MSPPGQNPPSQQRPSIMVTERFPPPWPLPVAALETRCPSRSCLTLFKYFKWVRCGAITWLLDEHQFIHQAGDGRSRSVLCLLAAEHNRSCEDAASSPWVQPSRNCNKPYSLYLMSQNHFRKLEEVVISVLSVTVTLRASMYDSGVCSHWEKIRPAWRYI